MRKRSKRVGVFVVSAIGFVSAVVGLWAYFYTPTPDSEIWLLPKDSKDVVFSTDSNPLEEERYLEANSVTVDGVKASLPKGAMIVANKIRLINGGEIFGDAIALIATQLEGGRVSATAVRSQRDGGDLFIAAAIINGTAIESNGANGRPGRNGAEGADGKRGSDGRNGKCKGFGGWRKAEAGGDGQDGGNGEPGQDGEPGGDAGSIVILTSYQPTVEPVAFGGQGGQGGRGGQGGAAGVGGPGGSGGAGCTGAGGSQSSRSNGAEGIDGKPGKDGRDGPDGQDRKPTVKLVAFAQVRQLVNTHRGDRLALLAAIRGIRPDAR